MRRLREPSGKPWYSIKASDAGAEIYIYEEIGDSWWSESKSAKQFMEELKALGNVSEIALHINSPGGSVFDGVAIYNALRSHSAHVTTHVDGYAASIASVVALAGDTIIMPSNAMLMIHNPWSVAIGDSNEMRKVADTLDKVRESMLTTYMGRCAKSEDDLIAALDAETWMTAADAAEWGFADEVIEPLQAAALSTFDFAALGFERVPDALLAAVVPAADAPTEPVGDSAPTIAPADHAAMLNSAFE